MPAPADLPVLNSLSLDETWDYDAVTDTLRAGKLRRVVLDKDLTALPGSPTLGAQYLLTSGALTGIAAGHQHSIAVCIALGPVAWKFVPPNPYGSVRVYVTDEASWYYFDGSAWAPEPTVVLSAPAAFATRPAAGSPGARFVCNDSPVGEWIDTGSAWAPMLGNGVQGVQPPAASGFTKFNGTTATLLDNKGTLQLTSAGSGVNEIFHDNVAAGATFKVETAFQSLFVYGGSTDEACPALVAFETSSGKFMRYGIYDAAGTLNMEVHLFTNISTGSTVFGTTANSFASTAPMWMRIRQDLTTMYFEYSSNGRTWRVFYSEPKASHVVADKVGLYHNKTNGVTHITDFLHYSR